jgi:L-arabinose isomerase
MKITAAMFYSEVTGKACGVATAVEALKRWEIPFDEAAVGNRKRGVDISQLPAANVKYAAELEARAARKMKKANGAAHHAANNDAVVQRLDIIITLLRGLQE